MVTRNQSDTKSSITLLNGKDISGTTIVDFNVYHLLCETQKTKTIGILELKRLRKNVEEIVSKLLDKKIVVLLEGELEIHQELIRRILKQILLDF
ncbi:hypothetical protein FIA58_007495 [Flavobacterium jejuense]|uniref:Uncharacterized protein n=1 Tax=Flavobacterium jejuense TaxID=1544455 RepID=A0ABX0IPN6_9FLAO|nr:hypothetical protein [Flavobacterium jejuense]NHN25518.1 hypothetical protein [Flavobacterium jejuense]